MLYSVSAKISSHSTPSPAVWNGSLYLFCNATGYPVPEFTWKFRGNVMSEAVSGRISTVSSSSYLHLTNLHAISHGGQYKCEASNTAGSADYALVNLTCEFYHAK